jgi:hypothetical protein
LVSSALHDDGVGQREMVGAQRIEQGAGGKAQLLLLDRIDALDRIGHGGDLLGHHQIGLMDQREEGIVAPARIGKALVLPGQIDRLVLGAKAILADHLAPQVQAVGPQFLLHGGRASGERLNQPSISPIQLAGSDMVGMAGFSAVSLRACSFWKSSHMVCSLPMISAQWLASCGVEKGRDRPGITESSHC